jgi:hypothetical protein
MRRLLLQRPGEGDMIMVLMSDSYLSAHWPRLGDFRKLTSLQQPSKPADTFSYPLNFSTRQSFI